MPLSSTTSAPSLQLFFTLPFCKGIDYRRFQVKEALNLFSQNTATKSIIRKFSILTYSVSRERDASIGVDVLFPSDYAELIQQNLYSTQTYSATPKNLIAIFNSLLDSALNCQKLMAKEATDMALRDDKQLMEIEFPTAGLQSVPGDGEGGNEMTGSMELIREFCDVFVKPEKATKTRIFFLEANEVTFAKKSVFGGASFKLDYLTKLSLFEDFGFTEKVKMADRVKPEDEMFVVAYPYFNVNEMLVVEELYNEAVAKTERKLIIFNGELDRIRSGYYPSFFYPKLSALTETLFPKMETVYYIHNFKGVKGGALFRCYPGKWKVLRFVRGKYVAYTSKKQCHLSRKSR